ncbi:protein hairy-like [Littorina saxatilis]|uniref:BHLH domain-containing protein n=1 Tax=Littorina saxatilis TaxID=31220 RepID=A0AAN9AV91_9CAEN
MPVTLPEGDHKEYLTEVDQEESTMPDSDEGVESDDGQVTMATSDDQADSSGNSGGGGGGGGGGKITTTDEKKKGRKNNKPKMEKRRRERMNCSLNAMKNLVYEAIGKNPAQYSKQEKAAVLEMTVDFLKNMKNNPTGNVSPDGVESYHAGYKDCMLAVANYLKHQIGAPITLVDSVVDHLFSHSTSLRQMHALHLQQQQQRQQQHLQQIQQLQHQQFLQQQGLAGVVLPQHPAFLAPAHLPGGSAAVSGHHANAPLHSAMLASLASPAWMSQPNQSTLAPPTLMSPATNQARISSFAAAPTAFQTPPPTTKSTTSEGLLLPRQPRASSTPSATSSAASSSRPRMSFDVEHDGYDLGNASPCSPSMSEASSFGSSRMSSPDHHHDTSASRSGSSGFHQHMVTPNRPSSLPLGLSALSPSYDISGDVPRRNNDVILNVVDVRSASTSSQQDGEATDSTWRPW